MKTYRITNQVKVLSLFEICLFSCDTRYQHVKLCLGPTPKGEVVAYLRTYGSTDAVGLWTDNGWIFGREAFGDEALDRLVAMMAKDGITANAIRLAAPRGGESAETAKARRSLADAIENYLAANGWFRAD